MQLRKIALCVEAWWSEENLFAWNFTRKRLLQEGVATTFADRVYILHVHTKGKEVESWDKGTPVLGDVRTELAAYDHCITELHGDVVNSIVQFVAEEGIHVAILSKLSAVKVGVSVDVGLKGQNRVKKTLSMGAAHQILAKARCAVAIVSPRFSSGDQFRIQAKLQPDALVANSAAQFRRRVAVVLNSAVWDSALTQYVAKNVILPGDRVILVRCLNENLNKKNTEEMQIERDYLRELGWHEFKRTPVSLAVEVIKNQTRVMSEFIDQKGVDLLIMVRSDSNKLKRSIKKDNVAFQSFPHKSPCPFMIVPTEVLRSCARFLPRLPSGSAAETPVSPFWGSTGMPHGLFSRKTWSAAFQGPHMRLFRHGNRRCLSLDSTDQNQGLRTIDYVSRDDSIELSSSAVVDLEAKENPSGWKSADLGMTGCSSDHAAARIAPPPVLRTEEDSQKDAVLRRLQKMLVEKESEVLALKQRIHHLQSL